MNVSPSSIHERIIKWNYTALFEHLILTFHTIASPCLYECDVNPDDRRKQILRVQQLVTCGATCVNRNVNCRCGRRTISFYFAFDYHFRIAASFIKQADGCTTMQSAIESRFYALRGNSVYTLSSFNAARANPIP